MYKIIINFISIILLKFNREQINSCADKNFCLKVNLTDLINFNAVLANNLREKPAVYLPLVTFHYFIIFCFTNDNI